MQTYQTQTLTLIAAVLLTLHPLTPASAGIFDAGDGISFIDMGHNPDTGEVVLVGTQQEAGVDVAKVFKLNAERTTFTAETLAGLDGDPEPQVFGISSDGTRIAGVSKSNRSQNPGEGTSWLSSAPDTPVGVGIVSGYYESTPARGAWQDGLVGDFFWGGGGGGRKPTVGPKVQVFKPFRVVRIAWIGHTMCLSMEVFR